MKGKPKVFEDVYEVVRLIPRGRVTSYGAIARYLGIKSARVVGWAMNASEGHLPAHRVLNSKGQLSGAPAFSPHRSMETLLVEEGIPVSGNRVIDFQRYFWDPAEEL